MAKVKSGKIEWDPFFGPPVRLGEGGMGWKVDKDPRSRIPSGGSAGLHPQLPDAQRSLLPNQELRHYAAQPPTAPYQQQQSGYYAGAAPQYAGAAPYYQSTTQHYGPPPTMLQAGGSYAYTANGGVVPQYTPAPHYYVQAPMYAQGSPHAPPNVEQYRQHTDPNIANNSVVVRGVTPREDVDRPRPADTELAALKREDLNDLL